MKRMVCTISIVYWIVAGAFIVSSQGYNQSGYGINPNAFPQQNKYNEFSLYPGESTEVENIKVVFSYPTDIREVTDVDEIGYVSFMGKETCLLNIPVGLIMNEKTYKNNRTAYLYVEGIVFFIHFPINKDGQTFLRCYYKKETIKNRIDNQYRTSGYWVSSVCPMFLNEWQLTVSEKRRDISTDHEYYDLRLKNMITQEEFPIRLVQGVVRKYGRYQFSVDVVSVLDNYCVTAQIVVAADPDYSIQGGDTLIDFAEFNVPELRNLMDLIEILGKQYQFTVEWYRDPEYPEIFDDLKERLGFFHSNYISDIQRLNNLTIKEFFNEWFGNCDFEWVNQNHVIVKPTPQMKEHLIKQYILKKKVGGENEQIIDRFYTELKLVTVPYRLKNIDPNAAKSLVDNEFNTYYLLRDNSRSIPKVLIQPTKLNADRQSKWDEIKKEIELLKTKYEAEEAVYRAVMAQYDQAKQLYESGRLSKIELDEKEKEMLVSRSKIKELEIVLEYKLNEESQAAPYHDIAFNQPSHIDILEKTVESAVVDERNNVLIVNAIPKTHERISSILERMEKMVGDERTDTAPGSFRIEITLLQGSKQESGEDETQLNRRLRDYGLTLNDLKRMELNTVKELGKGMVNLLAERGDIGRARVSLSDLYACQLEFMDIREPYLLVKGGLLESAENKLLIENTLFLQKDKSSLLGVTNLRDALILIVRLQ